MKIANINTDDIVFTIAEIGNNHEGDFGLAKEMIAAAAEAGAHAVKFQTIVPTKLVSATQTERIQQLSRFQFSFDQFAELAEEAKKQGTLFLSTPFHLEAVDFLDAHVPAFKVASSDNTFTPLLEAIAATGKPVLMSTGLCDRKEVAATVAMLKKAYGTEDIASKVALLHCVTAYPTPEDQANLSAIHTLANIGGTPGYSDHTLGIEAAVLSVAAGARIIEKHFTLDHNYSDFRDHKLSATPEEFAELVRRVREVDAFYGKPEADVSECELENMTPFRRSVVAKHDLTAGTVITKDNIDWVRPGGGIAPGNEGVILGKALTKDAAQGVMILKEDVK